jgi:hypothetical protein
MITAVVLALFLAPAPSLRDREGGLDRIPPFLERHDHSQRINLTAGVS